MRAGKALGSTNHPEERFSGSWGQMSWQGAHQPGLCSLCWPCPVGAQAVHQTHSHGQEQTPGEEDSGKNCCQPEWSVNLITWNSSSYFTSVSNPALSRFCTHPRSPFHFSRCPVKFAEIQLEPSSDEPAEILCKELLPSIYNTHFLCIMTWCVFKAKDESGVCPLLEWLVEQKHLFLCDSPNLPQLDKQGCLVLHISSSMLC